MTGTLEPPRTCPNRNLGDIQLETVLTPLLLPKTRPDEGRIWKHSPDDTHPLLRFLDLGCGNGRLLRAMDGFPNHILRHFEYVGSDPESSVLEEARGILASAPRLAGQLKSATFCTWKDLASVQKEYDFVFMVNVLHHVRPVDFPLIFSRISQMVKDGGALLIHDFYFGDNTSTYDLSKYCADGIFFGPEHVSSFFAMASSQTGIYRTMRRGSSTAAIDLFTFLLYFDNELSLEAYRKSMWYDDYFSYLLIAPGLALSLRDIEAKADRSDPTGWFAEHASRARTAGDAVERSWRGPLEDELVGDVAESWIHGRAGRPTWRCS